MRVCPIDGSFENGVPLLHHDMWWEAYEGVTDRRNRWRFWDAMKGNSQNRVTDPDQDQGVKLMYWKYWRNWRNWKYWKARTWYEDLLAVHLYSWQWIADG